MDTSMIVETAIDWFKKRQAFLDSENRLGNPDWRDLLNECSNGEHALTSVVRAYLKGLSNE